MAKKQGTRNKGAKVGNDFRKHMMPVGTMKSQVLFGTEVYEIEFKTPNWDITIGAEIDGRTEADALMGNGGGLSDEEAKAILNLCICKAVAHRALIRVGEVRASEPDFWERLNAEQVGVIGASILAASRPSEAMLKNSRPPAGKPGTPSPSQASVEAQASPIPCSGSSSQKPPS